MFNITEDELAEIKNSVLPSSNVEFPYYIRSIGKIIVSASKISKIMQVMMFTEDKDVLESMYSRLCEEIGAYKSYCRTRLDSQAFCVKEMEE